jgi:hypothetical protein
MNLRFAVAALSLSFAVASSCAQETKPDQTAPRTKLEAFEKQSGSVIIRGFSEIGSVAGTYGGHVTVESREFTNASSGKKEYGIVVEVKESGRLERDDRSFVDYEEIPALLKGLEYIAKVDHSVTTLNDFQADYRTKGDLMISTFSSSTIGGTAAAVQSGRIGAVSVIINMEALQQLRSVLEQAKAKLDAAKGKS